MLTCLSLDERRSFLYIILQLLHSFFCIIHSNTRFPLSRHLLYVCMSALHIYIYIFHIKDKASILALFHHHSLRLYLSVSLTYLLILPIHFLISHFLHECKYFCKNKEERKNLEYCAYFSFYFCRVDISMRAMCSFNPSLCLYTLPFIPRNHATDT